MGMRKIILGTDWFTDCDDAVAIRLITNAVKNKKIQLLGVAINVCMKYSVASLKGFLNADGIENVPIGIDFEAIESEEESSYQKRLIENFCPLGSNEDGEDAVRLYRKLLANEQGKVEIVEIGHPQVLANLLKSKADDISSKSGYELVQEKVLKLWVMAGKWDADGEKEYNFCRNARSRLGGKELCDLCPCPITFLGFEIGYGVITGGKLNKNDHLYKVLSDHGSENGRHSWDPMLVMMALIGNEEVAGYHTVTGTACVDEQTGANYFKKDPNGKHKYVIKMYENGYYEKQINSMINKLR